MTTAAAWDAAVALVQSLAQELPHAKGAAEKEKKKKKKRIAEKLYSGSPTESKM